MVTKSLQRLSRVALAASILAVTALPSQAEIWPGVGPAPGGALAARVIGLMCHNSLTFEEIYELDLYIARRKLAGFEASADDASKRKFESNFFSDLESQYIADHRDGKRCTADETAMAKDMVERVRKYLSQTAK